MNTRILKTTIAALCASLSFTHAEEQSSSASSKVVTNGDGTATVTIEVNGKKETKTIKLSDGVPLTLKVEDGGSVAIAEGGGEAGGKAGKPERRMDKVPWLGIAMEPVREEVRAQLPLKTGEGLTASHVMPDSPAAKAGVEKLDIITRLDDQIVVSPDQIRALIKMRKAGDKAKLTLLRKGEQRDVEVTIEEHDEVVGGDDAFRIFGGPNGVFQFNGKDFDGKWRENLKEMKKNFPGVVIEKQGWLLGPDGELKKFDVGDNLDNVLKMTRKYLDDSKLPDEARENIRSAVEDAIRSAERAARTAEKAAKSAGDAAGRAAEKVGKKQEKNDEIKKSDPSNASDGTGEAKQ